MDRRLLALVVVATIMVSLSNGGPIRNNELNLFKRDLHNVDNIDQAVTDLGEQNLGLRKRDVEDFTAPGERNLGPHKRDVEDFTVPSEQNLGLRKRDIQLGVGFSLTTE
ncbi:unnamed protein product [Adineta ricciae]|uniref:Uncharacterized protein n=1 Tax=Adineta ricciae TaxID=249248 RepID=A0A815GV59_ADIRI|nr:unnamed protein product [Adineta ricciae]CAF1343447.1 unnamed protein product [Adineta ricciae]